MVGPYLDVPPTVAIWQSLWNLYLFLGTAAGVIVISIFVYFMIRYRDRGETTEHKFHHEEGWGSIRSLWPIALTGGVLFIVGAATFGSVSLVTLPKTNTDPITVNVIAQQWQWTFQYPNGVKVVGNLTVPEGETIILNITSVDVAHSFFLPSLDIGADAIPGRYNPIWFTAPTSPVVDTIRCRELCGVGHAFMIAKLTVVSPSAYNKWYAGLETKK